MKRVLKFGFVLLLVLVIAVFAVFFWMNELAKSGIEQGATYALGVDTTLDEAKIGVFSGQFGLAGMHVANPPDFNAASFLQLNRGDVAVTLGSLMGDKVEVPYLKLSGIELTLEHDGQRANYDVILEHLKSVGGDAGPDSEPTEPQPDDTGSGKKYVIYEVVINDVTVNGHFKIVGDKTTDVSFKIPEIRLTEVGSDSEGGVLLSQVSGTLLQAVLEAVVRQGGDVLPDLILGNLDAGLQDLGKLGDQMVTEAEKTIDRVGQEAERFGGEVEKEVEKTLDDAGKQLEKGIGDLLGGLGSKESKSE